jgi:hypothetical protein
LSDLVITRVNIRLQQARLESDDASTVQEWMADIIADAQAEADAQDDMQSVDGDDAEVADDVENDDVVVVEAS